MAIAARQAIEFAEGHDRDSFLQEPRSQSATQYQSVILGEAARRISPELRNRHPEIPWKDITGTRSVYIHQYNEVDLLEVWKVISVDLPALIPQLEASSPRSRGSCASPSEHASALGRGPETVPQALAR